MSMKLARTTYRDLIAEDVTWLKSQPRTLERDHIEAILSASESHEYDCDALKARVAELEEGNVRRQIALTARVEALEGALRAINGVIAWSDTAEEWYLLPRLRTLPALEKVRAALGPTPPAPALDVLMRVAERQREACAARMDASATVWGDMVRATPLVTDAKGGGL